MQTTGPSTAGRLLTSGEMLPRVRLEVIEAPADSSSGPAEYEAPRLRAKLAWYGATALASGLLIFFGLRLDQADLSCPFAYYSDSLQMQMLVKATLERGVGGHWRNERLGAPDILELHDFPVLDHLHFLLIWLLGQVVPDLGRLYNIYYLLTYPLTALTAMAAFRQLRLTLPAAAVGGLLFAFLPYHYLRGETHYLLAAYWLVPLSLLPVLAICRGDPPFYRKQADGTFARRLASGQTALLIVLAAATGSGGGYYAFFTCAFLALAGLHGTFATRNYRAATSAAGLIALIVAFGAVNQAPALLYQQKHGSNPIAVRFSKEADLYGLKIAHLVLPIDDHNLRWLARIKGRYNSPFRVQQNENTSASLGAVGAAGLLGLLLALLLPIRSGWPLRPVAALTLFGLLLATLGGFGSVFNLLVLAQFRAYNRISVFIAFFCILAALWAVDRVVSLRPGKRVAWAKRLAWPAILIVGLLDQTPHGWFRGKVIRTHEAQAARYRADQRFFAAVEASMPPHASVFCLPYIQFPESIDGAMAYEHARAYLHTRTLRWSFGAMKGREADAWQLEVAFTPTDELLRRIACRGFDGLFLDERGCSTAVETKDAINAIYAALVEQRDPAMRNARLPEIVHEDGRQFFLDLRPYREELRQANAMLFDALARQERERVAVLWLNGFHSTDPSSERNPLRWGPSDGEVWIVNPADRPRRFQMSMTFHPITTGEFAMNLSGLVDDQFSLSGNSADIAAMKSGSAKTYQIEVQPGRNVIRIRCTPPPHYYFPEDNRTLCYQVKDFKIQELP